MTTAPDTVHTVAASTAQDAEQRAATHAFRRRLVITGLLAAAIVSVLIEVPALGSVAHDLGRLDGGWLALAVLLEAASCGAFVVIFRHFFSPVPAPEARRLAWTEMASGALLPGGGVGSLAVGGALLSQAGMPTDQIVRRSSGLFFLTSAVNVAAMVAGAVLLAAGLSAGQDELVLSAVPILAGAGAVAGVLALARTVQRRELPRRSWAVNLADGIDEATGMLRRPSWRFAGAIGYLGFDIAVLWATLNGVGYSAPISVLVLGYIIGYLANLVPVPAAIGVLEGGLAGTLVLYGAPATQAIAGVLAYHAIAFWVPSAGGLVAFRQLRRRLLTTQPQGSRAARVEPAHVAVPAAGLALTHH